MSGKTRRKKGMTFHSDPHGRSKYLGSFDNNYTIYNFFENFKKHICMKENRDNFGIVKNSLNFFCH
jgi:hypothetical protein